ncbi:DUF5682 family protein, partial [Streptomyces sp. NPDC059456]|uniref:DUF5682 family protein n=1 Tax=Streptomyces sp. NPDC059456 TaxID=3346838 RepID=UPI0036917CF1
MTTPATDPRDAVDALAASRAPYLLGVRHHSPALAAVVPTLLDAARPDVVCVELPADFQPWLEHLADPETVAPVALAGTGRDGGLAFYPFADFSPELAAIRWARTHGVEVRCCDLPLADPAWTVRSDAAGRSAGEGAGPGGTASGAPAVAPDRAAAPEDHAAPAPPPAGTTGAVPGPAAAVGPAVRQGAVGAGPASALPQAPRRSFAEALAASGTGRDGDDLWDRAVEVLAPGCTPEAVRRAALGVGWALRQDGPVPATDLAREARMRGVIDAAASGGRKVAALIGAFHAPALLADGACDRRPAAPAPEPGSVAPDGAPAQSTRGAAGPGLVAGSGPGEDGTAGAVTAAGAGSGAGSDAAPGPLAGRGLGGQAKARSGEADSGYGNGAVVRRGSRTAEAPGGGDGVVTSFVPYSFDLLDSRSGYPAGIRDPLWQQAVLEAGGDPVRLRDAASVAVTGICRELRRAGHTAGTGEAAETLRLACDLAVLRGLPAPGRGELLEAVTTVLGQGELLGRGRALARALEAVLVGAARGRITPHAPRSGLGPSVEAELAELRLPGPEDPAPREVRLDPLRSPLDRRREVLLQRLAVCGASYGEPLDVAATGDGTALGTKWRLTWTPSVPARLDLAGVRGVTAAQAASGTLRETARRATADGGPTPAQILTGLAAAARCDLPDLVGVRLGEAAETLPQTATLPELLDSLDLLEALSRGHFPETSDGSRTTAAALTSLLLEAAVRSLPGLAGSEEHADARALVALADRAATLHLGLRLDSALAELASTASPLMQGAALAVRVLLDLDPADGLGDRTAGWIDAAGTPEGRRSLARRLGGVLAAAGPLLQSSAAALTPVLDRIDGLADQEFLDRLPALRGGFDVLAPAARARLLDTVTERLGDRLDLSLDAPPALLALWAAADAAGAAALAALPLQARPQDPAPEPGPAAGADVPLPPAPDATHADRRLAPADRWRLLLGRERDRLPAGARRYAHALDELYGSGRGEGSADLEGGWGNGGGQEASFPSAREWSQELEALFGADVREEVLADAADAGRHDVLSQLDPAAVRPSVELLSSVLS